MATRACRFTAPYGSREIYHDGKPFIAIHRALNKHGTGSSRPVDVDTVGREIVKLLCGQRKTKSSLAGMGGIFDIFKPKKKPAKRHPMSRTVYVMRTKSGSYIPVDRPPSASMAGARRKRRRR